MTTRPAAKTIADSSPSRKSGGANAASGAPVRRSKAWIALGPTEPSSSAPLATYTAVGDAAEGAVAADDDRRPRGVRVAQPRQVESLRTLQENLGVVALLRKKKNYQCLRSHNGLWAVTKFQGMKTLRVGD